MKNTTHSLGILSVIVIVNTILPASTAFGQIVPDATLPINSNVTQIGNSFRIEGGTPAGGNLFHSFTRFNVPTLGEAHFNNSTDVNNIFTRVTGGSVSNIDGILRANGNSNLFFINPSGIIFGANAKLDIGGSFIGTSANSIQFADGFKYSAVAPQTNPLLTISVPVGLQFGNNPGGIALQGAGHNLTAANNLAPITYIRSNTGLQVKPTKTLALIGGNINLNGGILTAERGQIELGSVNSSSLVNLNSNALGFTFDYNQVPTFGDIQLTGKSLVDTTGDGAGSIGIVGRQVTLNEGSIIFIRNQGTQPGGDISLKASDSLELNGFLPNINISAAVISEAFSTGKSGNIAISTQRLTLSNGAQITSRANRSQGANININATESVDIKGFAPNLIDVRSGIGAVTSRNSSGNAGNIFLSTGRLSIVDGARITASTLGSGNAGNIILNTDSIELVGVGVIPGLPDTNPSILGSTTFTNAKGGDITINTQRLAVRDGAFLSTSSFANGSAGNITVNADSSVEVNARSSHGNRTQSRIISEISLLPPAEQRLFGISGVPKGTAGNVTINTPFLKVANEALISVKNQGTGDAGKLNVNAESVLLENQGSLIASTKMGEGGNIILQTRDLQLRDNSFITTSAEGNTGQGGNITINTENLVALSNSDIIANANNDFGGRVMINAQAVFGTQNREQITPESDITASSKLGASYSGVVDINQISSSPNTTEVELPETPVDPSKQITRRCSSVASGNSFVVSGNRGLPQNPTELLQNQRTWLDLRPVFAQGQGRQRENNYTSSSLSSPSPVIEATTWVQNEDGKIELIAHNHNQFQDKQNIPTCEET